MKMTDELMLEIGRNHGLISEQEVPVNSDANGDIDYDLPPYAASDERRKKICELLRSAIIERDKRLKRVAEAQEAHRQLREGVTNSAEPVQDQDDVEQPPPVKRRLLRFSEWRKRKAVIINPQIKGINDQIIGVRIGN
jgi:hypothetical protein